MAKGITCTCGHSWNISDSSKKDMNVCHICGKDNTMKNGGLSKYIQKIPETFGKGVATSDASAVQQGARKKKQIGNYKKVDSQFADAFRDVIPAPDNVAQMLAKRVFGDARMSNASLDDEQKVMLWDVMQNAKKRTGKPDGGTEYQDYGGLGYGDSEQFNDWFNRGNFSDLQAAYQSFVNPGFKLGSTIGRGRYWSDPENPDKMYYTDVYDWNAHEKNFAGTTNYQRRRNDVREGEDKNLNAQKNEKYRMNFELDAKEIEKLRKKESGGWLDKYNDGGPVQDNYNDYSVSASEGFQGDGYSNVGRNYSPAWGGQFAMGGSMPGATGFMYARTGSIPSNGKYAKKTMASAQNGMEMKYYQEGLDFQPKSISRDGGWLSKYEEGGVIQDDMGQYNHPGEITQIGSNQITMQGVPYPVLGVSKETGHTKMMYPEFNYTFPNTSNVIEYPLKGKSYFKNGGISEGVYDEDISDFEIKMLKSLGFKVERL